MKRWTLLVTTAAVSLGIGQGPVAAQVFGDKPGWDLFSFHEYGGDVNRPGDSPDRPYWHGDDAVPLGLRWQDMEAAQAQADAEDAAVAAEAAAEAAVVRRDRRPRHVARRSRTHKIASKPICIPVAAKGP